MFDLTDCHVIIKDNGVGAPVGTIGKVGEHIRPGKYTEKITVYVPDGISDMGDQQSICYILHPTQVQRI